MSERSGTRAAIFWLQVLYLLVLAVPASLLVLRPESVPVMFGPVPAGVPWFGALGAVMISLWGLTEHRADWDPSWKYWHWSRPFVGASLAVISVLIFKAGILAVGSTPGESPDVPLNLLYYVIAFVIGYREETFRELVKKVADIILAPGATATPPSITSLKPSTGPVSGGAKVIIAGTGLAGVTTVRFGATGAEFTIKSDSCIEATIPQVQTSGPVPVIVQTQGGRAAVGDFVYS